MVRAGGDAIFASAIRRRKALAKKEFNVPEFAQFEIKEGGAVFGTVRVKPSGILWAPKNSHYWFKLGIEKFGTLAETHGTKQKK
jgi:hypothetical protein